MKITTDSILIGAWADISESSNILDVGTGTGVISMICAQRNLMAQITAIDIEKDAIKQASDNIEKSPFKYRINVLEADYRSFDIENKSSFKHFDHIISNPPYFTENTYSPEIKKCIARNTTSLPFNEFICQTSKLLRKGGKLSVIIPITESIRFISLAANYNLFLSRRTDIADSSSAEFKRSLLEFILDEIEPTTRESLIIHENGTLSNEYKTLTSSLFKF